MLPAIYCTTLLLLGLASNRVMTVPMDWNLHNTEMDIWDLQSNEIVHQDPHEANLMHQFFGQSCNDEQAMLDQSTGTEVYPRPPKQHNETKNTLPGHQMATLEHIQSREYSSVSQPQSCEQSHYRHLHADTDRYASTSSRNCGAILSMINNFDQLSLASGRQYNPSPYNDMTYLQTDAQELPGMMDLKRKLPQLLPQILAIYQAQFMGMTADRAYEDLGLAGNATVGAMLLYGNPFEKHDWAKYVFEEAVRLRAQM